MTIARSEDISKDETSILNLLKKTFSFRKHFGSFNRGNFCTEVFVLPKRLMTKLNIPEASLYMSPLRVIVLSQQYCRLTVIL